MDAADVISLGEVEANPDAGPLLRKYLADANDDGVIDLSDTQYVVRVLLGTGIPIPLLREFQGLPVSFYKPPSVPEATEKRTVLIGAVSFYVEPLPPQSGEANTVVLGAVSFFFEPEGEPRPVGENDTVTLGAVSFFFESQSVPAAGEENVVQVGNPSFYVEPVFTLLGKEENTIELGTPSFERQ